MRSWTCSMSFLVDTNVLSELARRQPDPGVWVWASRLERMAISVITLEELEFGLAWKPRPAVARWMERFVESSCEVLPITPSIARRAGRLRGYLRARGSERTPADLLIAATAQEHQLTLVTRNTRHFEDCQIAMLNPFQG